MSDFQRYAIYYAPPAGAFADRVAGWLGWNALAGHPVPAQGPANLSYDQAMLTRSPRKYGFHGTLKPPFRLAEGVTRAQLSARLSEVARDLPSVTAPGLKLHDQGGFLALLPSGDQGEVGKLAEQVLRRFDDLRAPLTQSEIARRSPDKLSPRQRQLLLEWGYPFVLEQFQFHLTLTDSLSRAQSAALAGPLAAWLAPVLPRPFRIDDLCLFGEAADGCFHFLERHPLLGTAPVSI